MDDPDYSIMCPTSTGRYIWTTMRDDYSGYMEFRNVLKRPSIWLPDRFPLLHVFNVLKRNGPIESA